MECFGDCAATHECEVIKAHVPIRYHSRSKIESCNLQSLVFGIPERDLATLLTRSMNPAFTQCPRISSAKFLQDLPQLP